MFCISQGYKGLDICRSIADIPTELERTGIDDITRFFDSYFLQLCWRYPNKMAGPFLTLPLMSTFP